jgi:phosphoribosylaminoimidazole-succinocarboxamide synthase
MAEDRGLLLADTKYEFGRLPNGQIVVIDEVHTPDSSRYFNRDQFNYYLEGRTNKRPEQLSKEFVREWLVKNGFTGDPAQDVPHLPEEFIFEVSSRYQDLYVKMLGHTFEASNELSEEDLLGRIQKNIVNCLANISVA